MTGESEVNNTYSWSDSLSHVVGKHTLKLGGSFHLDQINIVSNSINNGSFVFQGTETGSDFADYLLGIASTYEQGDARPFYLRNKYIGAFAQDSWQLRSNLVLSYGLRWDVLPPWREKYNQLQTFVPGEQSKVYPDAPQGIVFPGDSGIPSTLSPTKWNDFAPRLGIAYSPGFESGILGRIFGGAGKSSIRAGYGIFYSAFEGLSAGIMSACAPYGYDYDSTGGRPLFNEPFVSATTGLSNGQPFPSPMPPLGASAKNPNASVNWSNYDPITGDPAFYYRNTSPYTESYTLSWERELPNNTFLKQATSARRRIICWCSPRQSGRRIALPQRQPAQRSDARYADLRTVQRRRHFHHGQRQPDSGARSVQRRLRRHHLPEDRRLLQLQRAGSFVAAHQPHTGHARRHTPTASRWTIPPACRSRLPLRPGS